jgi:hypothetical protein
MKRVSLPLAALAMLSLYTGRAEAGILLPHGGAQIYGDLSGSNGGTSTYAVFDNIVYADSISLSRTGTYDFNQQTNYGPSISTASASYHANPSPVFLGGQAQVSSIGNNSYSSVASGYWADVLHLNGNGPLPSSVKFTFHVTGILNVSSIYSPIGAYTNVARFFAFVGSPLGGTPFGIPTITVAQEPSAIVQELPMNGQLFHQFQQSGFDSFSGSESSFTATFSYIAQYDAQLQGYGFVAYEGVRSDAYNGTASAQFNDPLTADFVTNTDGTPLSGFTPSFDSGLSLAAAAAPEPSSLTLLGIGVVGLLGYGWRRRNRARTLA